MSSELKKDIHLLVDSPTAGLEALVTKLGESAPVFIDSESKVVNGQHCLLLQEKAQLNWTPGVVGLVQQAHINHPALEYLIQRAVTQNFSIDMNESYEDFDKEVFNYRYIDPFEEGEIGDVIAQKILDAGFDPLAFRSFHTALMGYFAHHVKRKSFQLPIEIQLGLFQGCVVVQVMAGSEVFTVEQIEESFKDSDVNNLYQSLLRQCFESCHILDISKVETSSKVMFTGIWCHDQYALPGGTLLYQNIKRLKRVVEDLNSQGELKLVFGKHESTFEELRLAGATARKYGPDEFIETDHPYIVKQVVEHCFKKIDANEAQVPAELESLVSLLSDFNNRSLLAKMNSVDWKNALRALQDPSSRELLNASVDLVSGDMEDDIFERVIESMARLSDEDIHVLAEKNIDEDEETLVSGDEDDDLFKQVVSGSSKDDKSETRISGATDNIKEALTTVKGHKEKDYSKEKTIIQGSGVDPLSEKGKFNNKIGSWDSKKNEILSKAKEKFASLKSKGTEGLDIESEMMNLIQSELDIDENTANKIIGSIVGESKDEVIAQRVKAKSEAVKAQMYADKLEQELSKRDHQIEKMKEVLQRKTQEASVRTSEAQKTVKKNVAKSIDDDFEDSDESSSVDLKMANPSDESEQGHDQNVTKIKLLESKLEHFKKKSSEQQDQLAELQNLRKENTALQGQVQIQASRNEAMSSKLTKQTEGMADKGSSELSKFRERLASIESEKQQAKDQLTRLDFSNRELQKKLEDKESEILRLRQAESEASASGGDEKSKALQREVDQAKIRERAAMHETKALTLKIRQLEQKLKFATAQIDKQPSRASAAASSAGGGANEKRLEKLNQKLADGMKAQAVEIAERKKEAMRFKADNNQLTHKLSELERQLAKYSKAS
tara:strand:- start:3679 stop:6363 length:2685 start_codon:yes stop_codon:yes gene_type:complete